VIILLRMCSGLADGSKMSLARKYLVLDKIGKKELLRCRFKKLWLKQQSARF
jgi:hypothetical protein